MSGSIELLIAALNANTAALEAHTAAVGAAEEKPAATKGKAATATKGKAATATKEEVKTPSVTRADAIEAITAVRDAKGVPAAKAILKKFGWDKAAAVTDEKAAEVLALCKAELGEEAEVEGDDDI